MLKDNTDNPASVPQPFDGYHVEIEYVESLPITGSLFVAVQTPQGLILGFVRRLPQGRVRINAFGIGSLPLFYNASEIVVVGRVCLKPRFAERRAA